MASRIELTVSELQSAASKLTEYANGYEDSAKQLKSAADELSATWSGDSQVAFVEEQQHAFEWYTKMAEIVRTYAEALNVAAQKYQETDIEAANHIKSR
ncbi:MAG: WXG100 family type VII secretion target [Oscillospiraceae bacterium]|nr:WXG100 family type VII secretion target [Oscillospiraceae bacterium]